MSSSSRVKGSRKNATSKRHNSTSLPHLALFLDPSKLEDEGTISRCLKTVVCVCVCQAMSGTDDSTLGWIKVSASVRSVGSD